VNLLEGINDLNLRGRVDGSTFLTSEELFWGYRQIVDRAQAHRIKALGATSMPEEGAPTASERGEKVRQTVNQWIRAKGNFDAVVDFDAIVRDPQRPARLKPEFDPGDRIHPNDDGNLALADAFDLNWFKRFNLIAQRLKKDSPCARTMMGTLTNGAARSGYILTRQSRNQTGTMPVWASNY
jgi:hypothetical protein